MTRTTAFTIILGVFAAPALAADLDGTLVPRVSLKDAPLTTRDTYRHDPAKLTHRYICYGDGIWPRVCDIADRSPSAPEKPKASGAR